MSDHIETSATCDVCRRRIVPIVGSHGEVECSDFCYRATSAERLAFTEMKPGDFGCWPCSECGCIVEDEFPGLDGTCSSCAPTRRIRVLESELERIRPVYEAACEQVDEHAPISTARLRAAVDAARSPR